MDPAKCKASSARVPLSPTGLDGGRASQLSSQHHVGSDAYECRAPRAVLLRVQARFRTRTTLRLQSRYGRRTLATSNAAVIEQARLAIRTASGRPLVYADVLGSGRARLFTARTCTAD